ncbi:MAG: tripartite tricarboxylate transporter substrate binding protein [Rhodoferax sp.]|uniref:Bug family tripartite tricarboxylate transporter substrate binding protein n=1 Tax=Rhodoferax sp. TaxID=50421 RepID=UPI00271E6607|nr:tripartite tricarboxylate transporter substrate binding protein [Rhodoferax sp.]MDO8450986.1 tripartite tricarboxylate transporter substrate binding protein [Rhodoferax sp.]
MISTYRLPALSRRIVLVCVASSLSALAVSATAADVYPSKPIRLIVPFAPGGPTDMMGRTAGKILSDKLGQPVVVENKAGSGGNIGTDAALKAAPDGYTLALSAISSLAIAPNLYATLPYDVARDVTPITLVGTAAGAIVAHPSAPFSDLKGLIAYAKANPGKLAYATPGIGTSSHLAAEYLQSLAGIQLIHVPYKGTSSAAQDLLAGVVPLSFESSLTTAAPNVKLGKLKAIAITAGSRSKLMPSVPTVAEQGFPGFDVVTWFGLVGPAGMPREAVDRLQKTLAEGLNTPAIVARFEGIGADVKTNTPAQFAEFIKLENERWGKVIKSANIKPE